MKEMEEKMTKLH